MSCEIFEGSSTAPLTIRGLGNVIIVYIPVYVYNVSVTYLLGA